MTFHSYITTAQLVERLNASLTAALDDVYIRATREFHSKADLERLLAILHDVEQDRARTIEVQQPHEARSRLSE